MRQAILAIPAFDTFRISPLNLIAMDRRKLKEEIWAHQYNVFRSDGTHPLQQHYTHTAPQQRDMPLYTHLDTPRAACNRARFRLARARLRVDQKRMGFQDITTVTCRQCGKYDETVQHVLTVCDAPEVEAVRIKAFNRINKLCKKYGAPLTGLWEVLQPHTSNKKSMKALVKAYAYTGRFINRLQRIWDC
jgi:hypothetical protein